MKAELEKIFIGVIVVAILGLVYNFYQSAQFKNNPIPLEIQHKIDTKVAAVEQLITTRFGSDFRAPVIISDELPSRLYGVTTYEKRGRIKIYLNKKRMRESLEYILDDVIPHEYAHAMMFHTGGYKRDEGHGKRWQKVCEMLEGKRCHRYVNHQDIISGKLPF